VLKLLNITTLTFDMWNQNIQLPPCLSTVPLSFIRKEVGQFHASYISALWDWAVSVMLLLLHTTPQYPLLKKMGEH
jgi:hypothetical protein